jgi:hypothetical protein
MRLRPQVLHAAKIWMPSSGCEKLAVCGTRARAPQRQLEGTWSCCSGPVPRAVRGMRTPFSAQPKAAASRCSRGCTRLAAYCIAARAPLRLRAGTCRCRRRASTSAVRAMNKPAQLRRGATIRKYCGGFARPSWNVRGRARCECDSVTDSVPLSSTRLDSRAGAALSLSSAWHDDH